MKCPYCMKDDTRVIDSRPSEENNAIKRRRECDHCKNRFTTYERIESIPFVVIKKDNSRELYDRLKIESGVFRSCHKRPVSAEVMNSLINDVETAIFKKGTKEINSSEIGELVMKALKDVDQVAYVRFASVYREFKDVKTFMEELEQLVK